MNEKVLTFGHSNHLIGILGIPEIGLDNSVKSAVLFLNAGLLHHVGPYRMYVDIARKLTSHGLFTFRFDISGIGDSTLPQLGKIDPDQNIKDIQSAMDLLENQHGINKFKLIGLCSGADDSHKVGINDPRITDMVLLDTYGYPTLNFYIHDYLPFFTHPRKWLPKLFRFTKKFIKSHVKEKHTSVNKEPIYIRNFPPRNQIENEINLLTNRGVRLLYIYSGGVPIYYNYAKQFRDMFPNVDHKKIDLLYFAKADHTYTQISHRNELITKISNWVC